MDSPPPAAATNGAGAGGQPSGLYSAPGRASGRGGTGWAGVPPVAATPSEVDSTDHGSAAATPSMAEPSGMG